MNCRDTQRTLFTQYDALLCAVSEWGMIWHGGMIGSPILQCEWVPDPESAVGAPGPHRLSGDRGHREIVGPIGTPAIGRSSGRSGAERVQCNSLSEGVVMNKTPSPYAHRTNRRECTHCAPFGQRLDCEWDPDATSEGFVPICLRLHRRPIGASDRLMIM